MTKLYIDVLKTTMMRNKSYLTLETNSVTYANSKSKLVWSFSDILDSEGNIACYEHKKNCKCCSNRLCKTFS